MQNRPATSSAWPVGQIESVELTSSSQVTPLSLSTEPSGHSCAAESDAVANVNSATSSDASAMSSPNRLGHTRYRLLVCDVIRSPTPPLDVEET